MRILLIFLLMIFGASLVGCSTTKAENHKTSPKTQTAHMSNKTPETKNNSYTSIDEYRNMITGENIKTKALQITRKENVLTLDMAFTLSDKLKVIMMNTKNKFYLSFSEVDGQQKLDPIVTKRPTVVEGNLDNLNKGAYFHLTQTMEIKQNATPEEIKMATSPENYELVFLDERQQKVAVFIGLDLNTIQS